MFFVCISVYMCICMFLWLRITHFAPWPFTVFSTTMGLSHGVSVVSVG